jgi:hypothetical protein
MLREQGACGTHQDFGPLERRSRGFARGQAGGGGADRRSPCPQFSKRRRLDSFSSRRGSSVISDLVTRISKSRADPRTAILGNLELFGRWPAFRTSICPDLRAVVRVTQLRAPQLRAAQLRAAQLRVAQLRVTPAQSNPAQSYPAQSSPISEQPSSEQPSSEQPSSEQPSSE